MRERGLTDEVAKCPLEEFLGCSRGEDHVKAQQLQLGHKVVLARETIPRSMEGATRSIKQKIFSNLGSS